MKHRLFFAVPAFLPFVLCVLMISANAGARTMWDSGPITQLSTGDNDGDGIPDDLDPDDDNDGVSDAKDTAPFDPALPGAATEATVDPLAPDQDSDGDGIPNDLDPDDNNNGSTDEEEMIATAAPSPTPLAILTIPTVIPTTPGSPVNPPPSAGAPVVANLPSTGHKQEADSASWLPLAGLAVVTTGLIAARSKFTSQG